MPTTEYTKTIKIDHQFEPGQVITNGRHTFYIIKVDAESEDYVVDDLDSDDGKGQSVSISYTDKNFRVKPKQFVYVCTTEADYEGYSAPISAHSTLEGAQASFQGFQGFKGIWYGSEDAGEWAANLGLHDVASIHKLEVLT